MNTKEKLEELGFKIETFNGENTTSVFYLDDYWEFKVNWANSDKIKNEVYSMEIHEIATNKYEHDATVLLPISTIEQVEQIMKAIIEGHKSWAEDNLEN